MGGVAGFWCPTAPASLRLLSEISAQLAHRGSEEGDYLVIEDALDRGKVLHRSHSSNDSIRARLALTQRDAAPFGSQVEGRQPARNIDGSLWLAFDGAILNRAELVENLLALGHPLQTGAETEVVMAAYRQWGQYCFARFTGMFAAALVDLEKGVLVLVRDAFGIKPLYYTETQGALYFASEVSALLPIPSLGRVDSQAAFDYLAYGLVDHNATTFVAGVRQVLAAHTLTVDLRDASISPKHGRYWAVDLQRRVDVTPEEAATELRRLLTESVALNLRSALPLGACLSGGIDSSSIVCTAAELLSSGTRLKTFTYRAGEDKIDETAFATLVSAHVNAEAYSTAASPEGLAHDLKDLVVTQDYPFGSTSI